MLGDVLGHWTEIDTLAASRAAPAPCSLVSVPSASRRGVGSGRAGPRCPSTWPTGLEGSRECRAWGMTDQSFSLGLHPSPASLGLCPGDSWRGRAVCAREDGGAAGVCLCSLVAWT